MGQLATSESSGRSAEHPPWTTVSQDQGAPRRAFSAQGACVSGLGRPRERGLGSASALQPSGSNPSSATVNPLWEAKRAGARGPHKGGARKGVTGLPNRQSCEEWGVHCRALSALAANLKEQAAGAGVAGQAGRAPQRHPCPHRATLLVNAPRMLPAYFRHFRLRPSDALGGPGILPALLATARRRSQQARTL